MDTFTASARHLLDETIDDIKRSLEGLDAAALNARPAGGDTNSIAVLVVHAMTSTRWWLSVAMDQPIPDRDRDREFEAMAEDPAWLAAFLDDMHAQTRGILAAAGTLDWSAILRPDADDPPFPRSFALVHCLAHLREHEGQISLTRQVLGRGSGE